MMLTTTATTTTTAAVVQWQQMVLTTTTTTTTTAAVVQWQQMVLTTFVDGCRPRYSCVQLVKRAPSVIHFRLSQTQVRHDWSVFAASHSESGSIDTPAMFLLLLLLIFVFPAAHSIGGGIVFSPCPSIRACVRACGRAYERASEGIFRPAWRRILCLSLLLLGNMVF